MIQPCPKCGGLDRVCGKGFNPGSRTERMQCVRCDLQWTPERLESGRGVRHRTTEKRQAARRKIACRLALKGWSNPEIAERLGVGRVSVWRWTKEVRQAQRTRVRNLYLRGAKLKQLRNFTRAPTKVILEVIRENEETLKSMRRIKRSEKNDRNNIHPWRRYYHRAS